MPGRLFCVFGPSNFPAADILHCRAQALAKLCKENWRPKKVQSVPKPYKHFSFKPQYSSDNQSESSSDEMQLGEDESKIFQSPLSGSLRKARLPHD